MESRASEYLSSIVERASRHQFATRVFEADELPHAIARELSRADRTQSRFSLLIVESATPCEKIDEVSRLLLGRKRLTDDVFRLSSSAFALTLPDTSATGARTLAHSIESKWQHELAFTIFTYPNNWFADGVEDVNGDETDAASVAEQCADRSLAPLMAQRLTFCQRSRDIAVSTVGLIALAPLAAIVSLLIKLNSRGPVLYRHTRIGWQGCPFHMYKFRSMIVGAEEQKTSLLEQNEQDGPAFKMTNDPRVTSIGRILRKLSIDEIPQLWNVLRGEMTLVGPRPLLPAEIAECETWQTNRLTVVPGITCTWQVEGRSEVSFADWMRMDLRYIREMGPLRDSIVLIRTIRAVLIRPNGK